MAKLPIQFEPSPIVRIPKGVTRSLGQSIGWGQNFIDVQVLWDKIGTGKGSVIFIVDTVSTCLNDDLKANNDEGLNFDATGVKEELPPEHGTHCAGTACAVNNGSGVVGYAYNAKLGLVRALTAQGGSMQWAVDAFDWIVSLDLSSVNPEWAGYRKIISCSWGSTQPFKPLEQAIDRAHAEGCIVTAAAGNDPSQINWPAHYKNVISIGSFGRTGRPSDFSTKSNELDIVMPGEAIISTLNNNQFGAMWGTSMANPAGAGLIACLLEKYPFIQTAHDVERVLEENAQDLFIEGTDATEGWDDKTGFGIPYAKNFTNLQNKPDEPDEPQEPDEPAQPPRVHKRTLSIDLIGDYQMPWRGRTSTAWKLLRIKSIHITAYTASDLIPFSLDARARCRDFFKNKGLEVFPGMDESDALYWTAIYLLRTTLYLYDAAVLLEAQTSDGIMYQTDKLGPLSKKSARALHPAVSLSGMDKIIFDSILNQ